MLKYGSFTSSGVGINNQPVILQVVKPFPIAYQRGIRSDVNITQDKTSKPFNSTKHLTLTLTNNNKKIHV